MRFIIGIAILLFFISVVDAQQVKKVKQPQTPFIKKEPVAEIAMRNAQKAFTESNYSKAKDLLNIAQNTLDFSKEKEAKILNRKCDDIIHLKDEALKAFIKKDFKQAKEKYAAVSDLNPNDIDAVKGRMLASTRDKDDSILIIDLNIEKARKIITYSKTLPCDNAIAYLKQKNKETPSNLLETEIIVRTNVCSKVIEGPTIAEQLALLKRQLQYRFNNCDYDGMMLKARGILRLESNNSKAKRYQFIAEEIKRRKSETKELLNDLSKTDMVISNYDFIKKSMPECPQDEYFMFLFRKGENLFFQKNCKECVKYFIKAEEVSPKLALKFNISEFIKKATEQCSVDPCKDKSIIVQQMIKDANSLYTSCQYDEAQAKFNSAKDFLLKSNCEDKNGIINTWEPIADVIKVNLKNVSFFKESIRKADSLLIEQECEKAILLYKSVDTISVNCEKLVKTDIPKKIKQVEDCIQEKCIDENEKLAQKSVNSGFYFDALKYYCEARDCSKDSVKLEALKKKICEVQKRFNEREQQMLNDNPNVLCVKCCTWRDIVSDSTIFKTDSTNLTSFDIILGSDLYKYLRSNAGFRVKLNSFSKTDFIDVSASLLFSRFTKINSTGYSLSLNNFMLPLALYVHNPKSKLRKVRPYLFGSFDPSYGFGVEESIFVNKISTVNLGYSYGLGLEKRNLGRIDYTFEVYSQNTFINSKIIERYIDKTYYGIRIGIGRSKTSKKQFTKKITKKVCVTE